MNIVSAAMADLTVSAAWQTSLISCERRDGRPHCESRMSGLNNILWVPMADLTVSTAIASLTNVLWTPMVDLTDISPSLVGANG